MILVERQPTSHWYLPDGTPYHTVAKADGKGDRPATLRDARKVGALPSVTNRLSILAKPGLDAWRIEQGILSALTLDKHPDESLDQFAKRIVDDSMSQVNKAAEVGSLVHTAAEEYLIGKKLPSDPEILKLFTPFQDWLNKNVEGIYLVEDVVLHPELGYAGRVDLVAKIKDVGIAVIDFKTQNVKRGKPTFYETWPLQLEAYRRAILFDEDPFLCPTHIMNVVINVNEPEVFPHVWDPVEYEDHWNAFKSASYLWSYIKGYAPILMKNCEHKKQEEVS